MLTLIIGAAIAIGACTRAAPAKPPAVPEPVAHPVPVELDWPDAGAP
ncbi:MAG: hypothetical protein K8W52_44355 [Deltaproteobacteria bacterium]|nr:hypothetical protein [Deltaproteobacteria bacterium]